MDELDDLAKRGRANVARNQAAGDRFGERRARERAEQADKALWRSLSLWGMFTDYTWFIAALFLVIAPLLVASVLVMIQLHLSDTAGKILVPIPPVVGTFLVMAYARFACRRAAAREHVWLDTLPFRVTGYMECLAASHGDNESRMRLTFDFVGLQPPDALPNILASDGGTWTAHATTLTRRPGPRTRFKEAHNAKVVRWFHRLVTEQLMPLHREHPFQALRVGNARLP